MNITRRHLLLLLPAAAVAWEHVLAGTPETSPNYKVTGRVFWVTPLYKMGLVAREDLLTAIALTSCHS